MGRETDHAALRVSIRSQREDSRITLRFIRATLAGSKLSAAQVADNLDYLQPHVNQASQAHGVPADLLNAVIVNESNGVANAVSPTGALGVTQQVHDFSSNPRYGEPINPFDTGQAINRQAAALSGYLAKYQDRDKAVAAYNQGEGAVDDAIRHFGENYLSHLDPEAQNYVRSIGRISSGKRKIPGYFGTPQAQ